MPLGVVEPTLKYHPGVFEVLTLARYLGWGQCMVGSLTGAVSSQSVTEEFEGTLARSEIVLIVHWHKRA